MTLIFKVSLSWERLVHGSTGLESRRDQGCDFDGTDQARVPGTLSLRAMCSALLLAAWKAATAHPPRFRSGFGHHNLAVIQGIFVK